MAKPIRGRTLFLDSSYAIALASVNDEYHQNAVAVSREIVARKLHVITTRAVCCEIGNALAKPRYRSTAVEFLELLERSATAQIIALREDIYYSALELFRGRSDKDWGLTDCISFVVMQQHSISEALTSDEHFEQAGYTALLR